eukprot:1889104-Rhodomonas_salina.2
MCGTDIGDAPRKAYGAPSRAVLTLAVLSRGAAPFATAIPKGQLRYLPTRLLRDVRYCIRACYAMSGTGLAYAGVCLRTDCAILLTQL